MRKSNFDIQKHRIRKFAYLYNSIICRTYMQIFKLHIQDLELLMIYNISQFADFT